MKTNQLSGHLHQLLAGTALLSLSSLIAKVLSAVYRVPFQNLVGDVGFYVYQQIYPLYGIAVTISLTGMPVFISQAVAKLTDPVAQRSMARSLLKILWTSGILAALLLWIGADGIAIAMGDRQLARVIRGIAPVYALAPVVATARGYRQGRFQLVPTALSQLSEQTVRVILVILVAWVASQQRWNVYRMGAMAMATSVVGSAVAILVLWPTLVDLARPLHTAWHPSLWPLCRQVIIGGGLLCLLAALMVLMQLVDAFTIKRALVASGLSNWAARSLKGVFDRAQTLVQLGLVIANSFAALLLPGLTKARQSDQSNEYHQLYHVMMHFCLLVSAFAAGGLIALMPQINQLLFQSRRGSLALAIEMVAIMLAAVINCDASVMMANSAHRPLGRAILTGLLVKLVTNYPLVMAWQIDGAAISTVLGLAVIMGLLKRGMSTELIPNDQHGASFAIKLTTITVSMMIGAKATVVVMEQVLGRSRLAMIPVVACGIISGVIIAIGMTLACHLLTNTELAIVLPGRKE